jgi:hypothetical protein
LDELFEKEKKMEREKRKKLKEELKKQFITMPVIHSGIKWIEAKEILKFN